MILTDYLLSKPGIQWSLAKQAGVKYATVRLPEDDDFDITNPAHIRQVYDRFTKEGITPVVIEPLPNCVNDHIKAGDEMRDESIEKTLKLFENLASVGIQTICMNFSPLQGWYRTDHARVDRGGALVTGFDVDKVDIDPNLSIKSTKVWENFDYFMKAVLPVAEYFEIKIALHPDDPPIFRLGNIERIFYCRKNIEKALEMYASDSLGITLCQGCYATMGEDINEVIRTFVGRKKVFHVHFRDVLGVPTHFHETFHNAGKTDMASVIRTYKDCGYHGPIRVDHVPTMAGEVNSNPGYEVIGRQFAIGYLVGLMEACGYVYI